MGERVAGTPVATLPPALLQARHAVSATHFAQACDLAAPVFLAARDSGGWAVAAEAALVLARARGNQRQVEDALRWAHEALQAAQQASRPDLACASWVALAREHAQMEEARQAQHAVDEAMALVGSLQTPGAIEGVYSALTAVYSDLGLTSQSMSCARHALAYAESAADPARTSMARTNLLIIGCVACEQLLEPDPEAAQQLLDELWPHVDRLRLELQDQGVPLAAARMFRVEASLHSCAGRWEEARKTYETLVAMAQGLPAPLACSAWIELGRVQRRLGLLTESQASGRAADAINPVPEPRRAVDLRRLSLICELTGRTQEALDLLRRYQDRRHHLVMGAMESRAAALHAQLSEQNLRVENLTLRQSNERQQARVEDVSRMASTDPLTGLLNRRGLEAQWPAQQGQQCACVLAMIDLDHFKRINDGHSHAMGDAVLSTVARLMAQTLRGQDRLARYGGEEFAALMLDIDLAQARTAMERLREAVGAYDWLALAPGIAPTVSVGLVSVRDGEPLSEAVGRADRLLYSAKDAGRNRVHSEDFNPPAPAAASWAAQGEGAHGSPA
jgi:diguanylate cyclase